MCLLFPGGNLTQFFMCSRPYCGWNKSYFLQVTMVIRYLLLQNPFSFSLIFVWRWSHLPNLVEMGIPLPASGMGVWCWEKANGFLYSAENSNWLGSSISCNFGWCNQVEVLDIVMCYLKRLTVLGLGPPGLLWGVRASSVEVQCEKLAPSLLCWLKDDVLLGKWLSNFEFNLSLLKKGYKNFSRAPLDYFF